MNGLNYHPGLQPFQLLRTEVDRLFDTFAAPLGRVREAAAYPALNVWEDADAFYAEAECPGLTIDSVDLAVAGNQLRLSGKRRAAEHNQASYHRQERSLGSFSRVLTLPAELDADKVEATLKNGVLLVKMPKAASAKPRKITVNAG